VEGDLGLDWPGPFSTLPPQPGLQSPWWVPVIDFGDIQNDRYWEALLKGLFWLNVGYAVFSSVYPRFRRWGPGPARSPCPVEQSLARTETVCLITSLMR